MNQFTILVILVVLCAYCGGSWCPGVLRKNKEILLGVGGGLVLGSFFGFKLEGMHEGRIHPDSGFAISAPGGGSGGYNYAYGGGG